MHAHANTLGILGLVLFAVGVGLALYGALQPKHPIFGVLTPPQPMEASRSVSSTFTAVDTGHYWPELEMTLPSSEGKSDRFARCIQQGDEAGAESMVSHAATWRVFHCGQRVPMRQWMHYFYNDAGGHILSYAVGEFPTVRGEQYRVDAVGLPGMRKLASLHPRLRVQADPLDIKSGLVLDEIREILGALLALAGFAILIRYAILRRQLRQM